MQMPAQKRSFGKGFFVFKKSLTNQTCKGLQGLIIFITKSLFIYGIYIR